MQLSELFKDHTSCMTQFQEDNFVTLREGGTVYGQYMQALRELRTRFENLKEHYYLCREKAIDIEELQYQLESNKLNRFERQRKQLDLERAILFVESQDHHLKEIKREFTRFYQQAVYLRGLLIEEHGELTPEKKHQLDKEMWLFKFKEMAVMQIIAQGRITAEPYNILMALPEELRIKGAELLNKPQELIVWYENRKQTKIPEDLSHIKLPVNEVPELEFNVRSLYLENKN